MPPYKTEAKGYDVTILENADSVGGFARTEKINGKNYDMATMFVPGCSIAGAGIEPTLEEMIAVSKEKLSPAIGFYTLDTQDQHLDLIPEPLQGYAPEDLVSQVLTGLGYSTQLFLCLVDPSKCASCEVCGDAGLNLLEWANQWNLPAYGSLIAHTFDGLGAAPAALTTTFANTLSTFAAADAGELLRNLGVTHDSLPDGTPPNIVSILSSDRWLFFDKGYQTFWEEVVKRAGLAVELGVAVQSMEKSGEGAWQLSGSNGQDYTFDQVVVTTAPQDAIPFVPPEQAALLAMAVPIVPPNDVFLVQTQDTSPADTDVDNEVVAFWPTGFGLGTPRMVDPALGGIVKPMFYQRRHDRDILVIATVTLDASLGKEEVFETVRAYSRDVLGLELQEESNDYRYERFFFPSGPIDKAAWDAAWATLQGQDGLWFNGEAFAGSGIPRITQYTKQFVTQAFPDV